MNSSDEINTAVLRLYECISTGDVSATERLFSHQNGVLAIGSDPNGWWADYDTIAQAFTTQFQRESPKPIIAANLDAFTESTVGWASERRTSRYASGKEIPIRENFVFHQEDGEWKIMQLHVSLGIPNADVF